MKKFLSLILITLFIFSLGGFYGCSKEKEEENTNLEKPIMLFQVDAGLGGYGLTTMFDKDDPFYKQSIENIAEGLKPLREKFEVAVLINPQHSYIANKDDPEKRIKDGLIFALKTFTELDIKVVLEIYSSDTGTNQNGELASLTKPNLYYGDGKETAGITMDMDALAYLKMMFPKTLYGVRMHELVGTHEIAKRGNNHGFLVTEETIKGIIDTCKKSGMNLVWSDHSWDGINDPEYFENSFFDRCMEYAEAQLNSRLTVIWANNNWEVCDYVGAQEKTFPYKKYKSAKFGLSNQSWVWESYASSNLSYTQDGKTNTKWFAHTEMDTPVELMASYTNNFLKQGANLIQFEPGYYFFNYHNTPWLNRITNYNPKNEGVTGFYEDKPDYSAKLLLKRFIKFVLEPEGANTPSSKLEDYINTDRNEYYANKESEPYTKYTQSTLVAFNGSSKVSVFDKFVSGTDWKSDSYARILPKIMEGEILCSTRANIWARTNDDFLVVKKEDGKNVGYYYTGHSGTIAKDTKIFLDNEDGEFVSATAGNYIRKINPNIGGDPDEIIVARKKGEKINLKLYQSYPVGKAEFYTFEYDVSLKSDEILTALFGSSQLSSANFKGILGVAHRRATMENDGTRALEGAIAIYQNNAETVSVSGLIAGKKINTSITVNGALTAFASIDSTITVNEQKKGFLEELAVVIKKDGKSEIKFISFENQVSLLTDSLNLDFDCENLISLRKGLYYRAG